MFYLRVVRFSGVMFKCHHMEDGGQFFDAADMERAVNGYTEGEDMLFVAVLGLEVEPVVGISVFCGGISYGGIRAEKHSRACFHAGFCVIYIEYGVGLYQQEEPCAGTVGPVHNEGAVVVVVIAYNCYFHRVSSV